jgi:hypothetical protein
MRTMEGQRRVFVDTSPEPTSANQQKSSTSMLNQTSFSNNVSGSNKVNISTLSAKPVASRQQSGTTITLKPSVPQ